MYFMCNKRNKKCVKKIQRGLLIANVLPPKKQLILPQTDCQFKFWNRFYKYNTDLIQFIIIRVFINISLGDSLEILRHVIVVRLLKYDQDPSSKLHFWTINCSTKML